MEIILAIILISLLGGIISGLYGGGSGLVYVPGFYYVIHSLGGSDVYAMQSAIVSTISVSCFLGMVASARQFSLKQVDTEVIKKTLWIFTIGGVIGILISTSVNSGVLKYFFAVIVLYIAYRQFKSKSGNIKVLSSTPAKLFWGMITGLLVCLSGVAMFIVPYYLKNGIALKKAIGTATVTVLCYSVISSSIYILFSFHLDQLPNYSFGLLNYYIFFIGIIPSAIGGFIGASLTAVFSEKLLHTMYIVLLIIVSITMLL
ncbi:sulfite exporter TauE/SafE family protein [Francisellaceae bacterium]|nr:sulfite exporter TauE/SafE family protein [Francisellaceae bacterium]